jgi:putative transposase
VKYAWIGEHVQQWPVMSMCRTLKVSVSGFKSWRGGGKRSSERVSEGELLAQIRVVHAQFKARYGSPRMHEELHERGYRVGKTRVERIMRENAIRARHKRRWKATTQSNHRLPVAANVIKRDFSPGRPNACWGSDITYIWTDEGWLYLAVVLDFFNREVVGWSLKQELSTLLAADALNMAWNKRAPASGLIHHSDRGVQYASDAYQAQLVSYGMRCSMSRKGDCWDNAPTESFFNSLKNELVHGQRYRTRAQARSAVFEYIEGFYNRTRRHSTLGYISPLQYLQKWHENEQRQAA